MKLVHSKPLLTEDVVRFIYCGELTVRATKAYLFNPQNVDKAIKDMFPGAMVVSYKVSGVAIG
ncbi:MAG: hypothetical protein AB4372_35865 [Xenococcus sp. (in: cyanobacteria)]